MFLVKSLPGETAPAVGGTASDAAPAPSLPARLPSGVVRR